MRIAFLLLFSALSLSLSGMATGETPPPPSAPTAGTLSPTPTVVTPVPSPTPLPTHVQTSATLPAAKEYRPWGQVGLALQLMVPNRLPQFQMSLAAYGPVIGFPIGDDIIRLEFLYASQNSFKLYWLDASYRWTLRTPFFIGFFSAGVHYFHYNFINGFDVLGGNMGTGLLLSFTKNLQVDIGMRVFVQQKLILGFGGGLSFFL